MLGVAALVVADLGALVPGALVIGLSHSGKTAELLPLPAAARSFGATFASITGDGSSELAKSSEHSLVAPASDELLGIIPSRSIIVQEMAVNMVVTGVVSESKFTTRDFQQHHPGGNIGNVLRAVEPGNSATSVK